MYWNKSGPNDSIENTECSHLIGCYKTSKRVWNELRSEEAKDDEVLAQELKRRKNRAMNVVWDLRIKLALRKRGISYAEFVNGILLSGLRVNKRAAACYALNESEVFEFLCTVATLF